MDKTKVKVLNLSADDQKKLAQFNNSSIKVSEEWMLLAEFGRAYGWEAYKAARNDEISLDELMVMVEANRRLEYLEQYRMAEASFAGSGSAQSRKPSTTFKSLTKGILKKTKAD